MIRSITDSNVTGILVRGIEQVSSIMVVDDDDAVRDSLAALLEPEGFFVRTYASVDAFLDDLDRIPQGASPTCLLLDLHMPDRSGHELLSFLAGREYRLPIVVMTGNLNETSRQQAIERGATAVLEKPVDADLLIETLRAAEQGTQGRTFGG